MSWDYLEIKIRFGEILYLQQLLDKGTPCCQQEEQDLGKIHSAGQVVGMHSRGEQVEVGHSRSSYLVRGSRRM